ncbi:MAG: XylR N-terminal domain-containing protein [Flavobacteriales bacterium]|nr:XylR N-terminal domain-containing protein [Flavobacteriales bacterium]
MPNKQNPFLSSPGDMPKSPDEYVLELAELKKKVEELERENALLKNGIRNFSLKGETVKVPHFFKPIFDRAQQTVGNYFKEIDIRPEEGSIVIHDQRYVLVRASALSIDFFEKLIDLYADKGLDSAIHTGRNFLFDIAHVIGQQDANNFHVQMGLKNPVERLSAGPVHFAYTGWAFVDIAEDSRPEPGDEFLLKYDHPFSFEADSWIKAGKKADFPVCIMNAGYSSGWCEASFGTPLTAVEVTCRAKGDDKCTFIMAPPHRIKDYLPKGTNDENGENVYSIPMFFERKQAEEAIKNSLKEKELLLKEIHHRVKNNLQIISSLLKLQSAYIQSPEILQVISDSQDRIKTMAIVHEKLYQSNLGWVDLSDYLCTIAESMIESVGQEGDTGIELVTDFQTELITLKIDQAIPIGLIINEIITNALKYAFPENQAGKIIKIVGRRMENNRLKLEIGDNGQGLPDEFKREDSTSFGMELIRLLTEQLDGELSIKNTNGTWFQFEFPLESL